MKDRFTNPGIITNYEIEPLREQPQPRRARWRFIWSTLSEQFHPRSQTEWDEHNAE